MFVSLLLLCNHGNCTKQGARSHSASDIFQGHDMPSDDEEIKEERFSYHGSIDENTLAADVTYTRRPSISSPPQAVQRKVLIGCYVEACAIYRFTCSRPMFVSCSHVMCFSCIRL